MSRFKTTLIPNEWKRHEIVGFRLLFLYFILQAVPLDWKYYRQLFAIDWLHLQYRDIFYIARYTPQFTAASVSSHGWGMATFTDWGIVFVIALAGTVIWTLADPKRTANQAWYYWLRTILRYRLAIGVMAYGFIKLFPILEPYPSISHLNTNFGDFNAWKFFTLSVGVVPTYQSFLGGVEILAGGLLLYRRTATVGAVIISCFLGNVFLANLAYGGGEAVYSLYLVVIAAFLTSHDAARLYTLLALGKPTSPPPAELAFSAWGRWVRLSLKSAFLLFLGLYGYQSYASYHHDQYHYPKTIGLPNASGLYRVKEFRVNQLEIPYSLTDSSRWQDVVFEKWATVSMKVNQRIQLDSANTQELFPDDGGRNFEVAGTARRHFYSYQIDTLQQTLTLQNKNRNYPQDRLILHYERPDSARLILSGITGKRDSIYVVLDKVNRYYLLDESVKFSNAPARKP